MHNRMLFRVALVGMFASMLAPAAQAHAFLDHAVPAVGSTAPPTHEVRLWFTEAVEPAFSAVTVTNAAGDRVNDGKIAIDSRNPQELRVRVEPLKAGVYHVQWRVISVDTHRTQGNFSFTVG
jgi:methionine-rich copper-binding protein CopC